MVIIFSPFFPSPIHHFRKYIPSLLRANLAAKCDRTAKQQTVNPCHPRRVTRAGIRKDLECKGRETWPISKGGVGKAFLKVSTEVNVEEMSKGGRAG